MTPKFEAALYAAFSERFEKQYRNPTEEFKQRVWSATLKAGFGRTPSERLLQRALEIATEQKQEGT